MLLKGARFQYEQFSSEVAMILLQFYYLECLIFITYAQGRLRTFALTYDFISATFIVENSLSFLHP